MTRKDSFAIPTCLAKQMTSSINRRPTSYPCACGLTAIPKIHCLLREGIVSIT